MKVAVKIIQNKKKKILCLRKSIKNTLVTFIAKLFISLRITTEAHTHCGNV